MGKSRLPQAAGNARTNVSGANAKSPRKVLILCTLQMCSSLFGQVVETPFGQRSTAEGETRFTEMPAERTGIFTTNRYDDPRMWGELHSEYNVGAIGTGVAVGDYDGDGLPDIFIVSKVESGRLFRNLGDWRFEDVTEVAGLLDESRSWKQGAAFVDVNNDRLLDLYVCRFDAANQLYVNLGDGTFSEEAEKRGLAVVDASGMGCFADYDQDGWLDVFIQTNLKDAVGSTAGQRDYLFRNRGDGTFENVSDVAGILPDLTQGHSATWWDQNDDGWLDLYVANDFAPEDILYRNNGDGTFANAIDGALPHTPFSSMGSDFGDINNDGLIDFFVADMAGSNYEFTQRGLADSRSRMTASYHDQADVAIQTHYNALYLNTGKPRSIDIARMAGVSGTDWTWSPRFEDLDSDGRLDLFVTNGMDREHNNLDFIVKKLSAINVMNRIRITKVQPVLKQRNLAYRNVGDLSFQEVGREWGLDKLGVSFGSAFGDFDLDGDLDVVFTNYQEGATVLRNDSSSGNNLIVSLEGKESNSFGVGAKVTIETNAGVQTRQLIPARGYLSTSEPVLHFGLGEESQVKRMEIRWPSGSVQVVADLKAGNRYVVSEYGDESYGSDRSDTGTLFAEVSTELGLSVLQREESVEGTVDQPLLTRRFNRRGPGLAAGDLDGDGADEIVFGGTAVDGAVILTKKQGRYQKMDTGELGNSYVINDGPPLVFDANGDGLNDLLLTGGGASLPAEEPEYEPRLWLNSGDGKFRKAPDGWLPSLPFSVGAAVSADFNGDGKLDLFLGSRLFPGYYPEPAISALLFQEADGFREVTRRFARGLEEVGMVTSALASDVDGDGWIDLLVSLEWGGVKCFRNIEGKLMEDVSERWGFETAGRGLWSSIAAGDFNRDGRLDYVLGNQGLNTIYEGTREDPMRLFYGDFGGSGDAQMVLAYSRHGVAYPLASRDELAAKIPEVKRRFPSNNDYASAPVGEVLGEEILDEALVLEANELRSGVLLSEAGGGFRFEALPREAQVSPIQGLGVGDFDGDGNSDIVACQNDFSSQPSMGRFDSGLGVYLKGDGRGGFQAIPLRESGWVVPNDAKALCVLDLNTDGRPDVLVSRNNESSLAFETQPSGAKRSIAVRLKGKGGNRDGIGAKVVLRSEEGIQKAEVAAGGGFASQGSALVFFSEAVDSAADLEISWPSGTVSKHPVSGNSGYVEISEP